MSLLKMIAQPQEDSEEEDNEEKVTNEGAYVVGTNREVDDSEVEVDKDSELTLIRNQISNLKKLVEIIK